MILFYDFTEQPYGCFSNLSPHGFDLDGLYWRTVEHYFQSQKFAGTRYEAMIARTDDPKFVASVGKWRELPLRLDWEQVKDEIMYRAVLRKFETHDECRQILLSTDSQLLVENAPKDRYWGIGSDGSGLNRLGHILMEVRDRLRAEVL